jgi:antitoxin (DNA-binding transcriptional repressor) of toxin-antitoxin stability system
MRTATVRELRNNFATLAKYLEWGEQVRITRNGRVFATLSPAVRAQSKTELKAAWRERLKKYKPVGRKVSRAETDALWSRLRD